MQITSPERVMAGLAAVYFIYRLCSGLGAGVIDGDGDMDVRSDRHPMAFALTAISMVVLIALCVGIALGPSIVDVPRMLARLQRG